MLSDSENQAGNIAFPAEDELVYTSCYCEENIWKLCEKLRETSFESFDKSFVVFVTNASKRTPIWCQKTGSDNDKLVIWDYHVFLVFKCLNKYKVFDFDTTLDKPSWFHEYYTNAIRSENGLLHSLKRTFRIIPANIFLTSFASDRSHMLDKNNQFLSPPPKYPPISCDGCTNNFQDFLSVDPQIGVGQVTDINGFLKFFRC